MAPDRSGERAGILGAGGLAVLGGAGGSFGGALGKKALEKIGSALKKAKRGK
jgi:hypothetical protein